MATATYNVDPTSQTTLNTLDAVFDLEKAVGVSQHHDAITGTEKQAVADDYHERLTSAQSLIESATVSTAGFQFCPLLNISDCQITEDNDVFTVHVYNPRASVQPVR